VERAGPPAKNKTRGEVLSKNVRSRSGQIPPLPKKKEGVGENRLKGSEESIKKQSPEVERKSPGKKKKRPPTEDSPSPRGSSRERTFGLKETILTKKHVSVKHTKPPDWPQGKSPDEGKQS